MNKVILILLSLSLLIGGSLSADQEVGNGGDAVKCDWTEDSEEGYYFLDYIIARERQDAVGGLKKFSKPQFALDDIKKKLENSVPTLGKSLEQFMKVQNQAMGGKRQSRTARIVWMKERRGLISIKNKRLIAKLPSNCREIYQVIRRSPRVNQTYFYYDPWLLKKIKGNSDQFSWLMVHEWLWSHTQNIQLVREVNEYVHSADFHDRHDNKKIALVLDVKEIGLYITKKDYDRIQLAIRKAQKCIDAKGKGYSRKDLSKLYQDLDSVAIAARGELDIFNKIGDLANTIVLLKLRQNRGSY